LKNNYRLLTLNFSVLVTEEENSYVYSKRNGDGPYNRLVYKIYRPATTLQEEVEEISLTPNLVGLALNIAIIGHHRIFQSSEKLRR
jgi:hypothetical protein